MLSIAWHEIPKTLDNLFYCLELLIAAVMMTNLLQYCYHRAVATRSGTHWQKFGPVYYVLVANVFTLMMPLAVVFIYIGEVNYPDSKMWRGGSWFPNTGLGATLYILKWIGTVCLMVGVVQVTNLHRKIQNRWREIRNPGIVDAAASSEEVQVEPAKPAAGG